MIGELTDTLAVKDAMRAPAPANTTPEQGPTPGAPEARRVRAMFDGIAPRYDLLNHLLSFQLDRLWRRRAAARALAGLSAPRVLDLCTGTGDLALALERAGPEVSLFAADFSLEMLARAANKQAGLRLIGVDALALPFQEGAFDLVTAAFGVRNFADRARGFHEVRRVLKPGGRFVVLEFTPAGPGALGALYRWYSRAVLPRVGAALSRSHGAYRYLPASVDHFPGPEQLAAELRKAGFRSAEFERLAFGTVALHSAWNR
jgi:demethylmenaquinone methyltransferase/2-methoxy-6-polyprenyl-1,4-benzoquinol methylase